MYDVILAALIVVMYGAALVAVLKFGRAALRDQVVGFRGYQALVVILRSSQQ
jgi:hypothetical protein